MIDETGPNSAEILKSIVARVINLREERRGLTADIRDVLNQAKLNGFDAPTISALVIRAEKDPKAVLEADALLETYELAVGTGAHSAGTLEMKRNDQGVFEAKIVTSVADINEKLSKAAKQRQAQVALAELSRRAREG